MLIRITDIIQQAIALYRRHFKIMIQYIVLLFIPGACSAILPLMLLLLVPADLSIGVMGVSYVIYGILALLLSLVSFWFTVTLIRVLAKLYDGTSVLPLGAEIQQAKSVVWPALGVSILTGLAVFGGTLLLVIPGIIFAVWFAFAVYGVAIHHTSPIAAMKDSKALVEGRWWAVCWRLVIPMLVFGIAMVIVQYIVEMPLTYVLRSTDPNSALAVSWNMISILISSFTGLILLPLTTAVPIILYTDLKKHPISAQTPPPVEEQALS